MALHRSFAEALARGAEAEAQSRLQVAIQRAPALLSDLHAAVVAYETIAHRAAHDLLITEAGLLLLLLGVLAGLGGLYLRPMARSFAEQLEEVEAAKAESERHRHAVQLVLDGSGDGLLLCSLDGDIGEVVSTNIIMWFGPFEGRKIWELLYDDDEERQASLQLLVEEIKDDIMPFEVVVDQMTRRIQGWDGQTFEFDIRKVDLGFDEPQLLFTVRDITAALAAQRIAQAYEEIQTLVSRVVKDVRGFRGFVADQTALMDALDDRSLDAKQIARILHTLKGNASLFGMAGFAQSCHSLEDQLDIDGPPDDIGEWADALRVSWRGFAFLVEDFLTDDEDAVQVSSQEHAEVVAALEAAAVDPQLLARVQTWTWEPAELRLRRLADQAAELGERIGKAVDVEVVAPELRVPKTYLERFWPTLVHVVRNSLDHGIEAAEDREAAGKPSKGRLRFEARRDEEAFVLTLSDDGAGIDWDRLRAKASEKGLSVEHTADVLFLDGVSSRDAVSDLSGRGVGMADVKATA
ncbi:MAG: Hpt domain-containing protein, partial [Myxococcota bacterium]